MEYILFIHNNVTSQTHDQEWEDFFVEAQASGIFLGGSEIGKRIQLGQNDVPDITQTIGGFMRFDAPSIDHITALLEKHPVLIHGGTLELCEMPKS